ncbi:MAG: GAF domain-containing protein, partial [Bacteroidota bacterium]
VSEGLAQFGALLRSNLEADDMFDRLISELSRYIKANQGGVYLVEKSNEDVNITLKSCYAYSRKKFTEYSVKPGQGLLGQSYYEKDIIYLLDIPQDYVKITSGLGEALPTTLIIVPLMVNEEIEGFFEFASFKEFEDFEIQFLKDLGETIGSFISVNRINEQTK